MNFTENNNDRLQNMSRIAMVALLHVLLLFVVMSGAKMNHSGTKPVPLYHPIYEPPKSLREKIEKTEPLPTRPTFVLQVPQEPLPPFTVEEVPPSDDSSLLTTPVSPPSLPGGGDGPVIQPKVHADAVLVSSACEKPEYPSSSIHEEETGTVTLAMLVDIDGRVLESKIDKSSGYRVLDNAARSALSLCKFKPGSTNGVAEKSWTKIKYAWRLDQ